MKNITLSADERLIEEARKQARASKTTLTFLFRQWLAQIAQRKPRTPTAEATAHLDRLARHLSFDRKFSREEMNER